MKKMAAIATNVFYSGILLFAASVLTSHVVQCTSTTQVAPGTTPHIREIFLGRCLDFQINRNKIFPEASKKNCTKLFDSFVKAVNSRHTCESPHQYSNIFDDFLTMIDIGLTPKDKTLFWSGTQDVAHDISYTNRNYITLEDTFPGNTLNMLNFCAGNQSQFNFMTCKCGWLNSTARIFWASASKQFAQNAQGEVKVFVNGTRSNSVAFDKRSLFATVELPNLNENRVKAIKVLVGLDLNAKPKETCNRGSIVEMINVIKKKNILVSCVDNPSVVFHTMCTNYPTSSHCQAYHNSKSNKYKAWRLAAIILAVFVAVLLIALVICLIILKRRSSIVKHSQFDNEKNANI